jgi:hypothetical protein
MNFGIPIRCVKCAPEYILSTQTRVRKAEYQITKSTGTWRAIFVCLVCGDAFKRQEEELQTRPVRVQMRDPELDPDTTRVLCISFECGEQNCGLPIIIHALADSELTTNVILQRIDDLGFAKECERSHPKTKLTAQSNPTRVPAQIVLQISNESSH